MYRPMSHAGRKVSLCLLVFVSVLLLVQLANVAPAAAGTIRFRPAVSYPVLGGGGPTSIAAGDFDQNLTVDLATANFLSHNGSTFMGVGDGTFIPSAPLNLGGIGAPQSVAVGDFDNSGTQDLAVASQWSATVSVLLGVVGGGFAPPVVYPSGGGSPMWIAVGNVNGDAWQDLVVANAGSNNVAVLRGIGGGNFGAPMGFGVGGASPYCVAVGDFNKDNAQDLVTANIGSGTFSILQGNNTGNFFMPLPPVAVGGAPFSVAVGDFDSDGWQDLAVANIAFHNVSIWRGMPMFNFFPQGAVAVNGFSPYSVAVSDFDQDGIQDLVTANYNSHDVSVLQGTGGGAFAPGTPFRLPGGGNPYQAIVDDFDGDGTKDIATANYGSHNVSILIGDNTPPITSLEVTPTPATGEDGWYTSDATITLTPNEPCVGTNYQWNADGWLGYGGDFAAIEGSNTLSYCSTDVAGNIDDPLPSTTIKVDRAAPTDPALSSPSHTENAWSNDNTIEIHMDDATDTASGVEGYGVSWTQDASETPDATKNVEGAEDSTTSAARQDGTWYFNLRTKDDAGNWTSTVHMGPFWIDTTPPSGTMIVNSGDAYTSDTSVTVTSSVTDSNTVEMRFNPGTGWTSWESYDVTKTLELPEADGRKTVRAEYRDEAGNTLPLSDTIILDTMGPEGSFVLDAGATYATTVTVSVHSSVVGATEMHFRNAGGLWDDWRPYWHTAQVTLTAGDGAKTVDGEYRDTAGNTISLSDSIILDTAGPTIDSLTSSTHPTDTVWYANDDPAVSWTATETASGITGYSYVLDHSATTDPDTTSEGLTTTHAYTDVADGEWYFHVRAQDGAGNWGDTAHRRIRIDRSPVLLLQASSNIVGPLATPTLTASLVTSAGPVPGREITLWTKPAGGTTWTQEATATDIGDGTYEATCACSSNTVFKMRFAGDGSYTATDSNEVGVSCSAALSRPWTSPATPTHGRAFSVYGYLTPKHAGTTRLYFYRKVARKWRYYTVRNATHYNYSATTTRYKHSLRLPYAGSWYVRARHEDASHLGTNSPTRYFTVR